MDEKRRKVLIVEDQKINRDILKGILHQNYEVKEATNGLEALAILKEDAGIAAILLDLRMPVMDGYAFLSAIAPSPYAPIPVIAVTGENDSEAEEKVLELGAWDFVSKPYQPMTLLTRLKAVINRSEYFHLGNLLLNSLGVPAAVFEEEDGLIRLIRLSRNFTGDLAKTLPFNLQLHLSEQPFLSKSDQSALNEAFQSLRKNKEALLLCLTGVNSRHVQLALRYWGETSGAIVAFGEFKLL
jgi:CheY-like chemotaxis protein